MPFAWTPAALDDLHRLFVREKLSAAETARALSARALGAGVSRNAVLGKVQRLGWTREEAPKPGRPAQAQQPRLAKPAPRRRPGPPFSRMLPLPKLREITVISTPKPWTERGERECAFPVGEPAEPGRQYSCCAPVSGRSGYCAAHRALMTLEATALTAHDVEAIVAVARRAA
jgi:GcrA cell cycle regulator